MVKALAGAFALAALPSAFAFQNTSPFFLFSTADLHIPNNDALILASSSVTTDVLEALDSCPTQSYLVVEQDGVSSADFADGHSTPQLSQYMQGKRAGVKTTYAISDVVGQIDAKTIVAHIRSKCGVSSNHDAGSLSFDIISLTAPGTSQAPRLHDLQTNDAELEEYVVNKAKSQDYTIIYITTPPTESQAKAQLEQNDYLYDMEHAFEGGVQMELKRDLSSHIKRANSTQGGLFERYQYFTPGLFMGFAAIVPLFLILLVGIRALTSLEVSYYAFSKEMGPNAQKKQ